MRKERTEERPDQRQRKRNLKDKELKQMKYYIF